LFPCYTSFPYERRRVGVTKDVVERDSAFALVEEDANLIERTILDLTARVRDGRMSFGHETPHF
jgi:hypothetical protein